MRRRYLVLIAVSILASMGAQHRTPNFIVEAGDPQVAQLVGKWAEHYRREKAILWLGQEMPTWQQPCPLQVVVNMDLPKGETSFSFYPSLTMTMVIEGQLERLIGSVLPHEITHTVFAYHFRCPLPRWADEGGSVLSEDLAERDRHDKLARNILNRGQEFKLRELIGMKQYPREMSKVMCLYAEGYSLADYLVKRRDRSTYLAFIGDGMNAGWDHAVQTYYGHRTVEELEQAWLQHLRDTKSNPNAAPTQVAQNNQPQQQVAKNNQQPRPQEATRQTTIARTTVPPVQPLDPVAVYRGAAPSSDPDPFSRQFSESHQYQTPPIRVPTVPSSGWQPAPSSGPQSFPAVHLGQPQFNQAQFNPQFSPPQYVQPGYVPSCPNCAPPR